MIKGLRLPYFAKYNNNNGTVTYSDGGTVGKAVQYSVSIQKSDDNHAYADDGIAETDKGKFLNGNLSLQTSNLSQELSMTLFGLTQKTITVDEKEVTVNVYSDGDVSPDLGFGIIEWHQVDGVDSFRAIVLLKTYFSVPEDSATTKGETVSWQNRTIEGVIQRSDEAEENGLRPWKYEAWFDTAAEAEAFLRTVLNIPDPEEEEEE